MRKITFLLMLFCFALPQLVAQQKEKEGKPVSRSTVSLENLVKQKSTDYVITAEHTSRTSGIHHMYLRQAINGLEVYGTESSVHLDKAGKAVASHNNFMDNIQSTVKSASASLSAEQAIAKVAQQMGYKLTNLQQLENFGGINKKAVFSKAGISSENIPVKLMYYYREGRGTFMVWELSIQEKTSSDWWNFRVDANSGNIIDKDNWTVSCNINGNHENHSHANNKTIYGPFPENCEETSATSTLHATAEGEEMLVGNYRVYAMPIENPNYGVRTLVANPDNALASPFGWHDTNGAAGAEFTRSQGNNAEAYDDDNANNTPDGKWAEGGGGLVFDFPLNTTYSAGDQSEAAAITNLFYWSNIIHDVTYQYGFDEVSGNFQENNYGNGGLGSDYVYAEAQDGESSCNANFGTPVDGGNPRMQMFVCNTRDGDLDNMVIIHEYGHGISNRLTGGPANSSCLQNAEQMGEGWSDYYGLMLTMQAGDAGTDSRGVGTWLIGEGPGGDGIRQYPYSTNLAVNPHTYGNISTVAIPHGVGSVWAMMLWEMTWEIIAIEGFDTDFYTGTGGNNIALALVTEGMKLQPCSPGFVNGRDAILAADMALYGGAYQCVIWEAFAKRGLGYSASQGSSNSAADGTQAFDLPPNFASFNTVETVCLSDGIQTGLSGGLPVGGVYSGAGVTDDGNGTTYTFDPSIPGAGTATVTYSVIDACTGTPTALNDTIEVTDEPPVIICVGSGSIPTTVTETVSPGVPIPDNNPTGVSTILNVPDNFNITDLDVNVDISHTFVGDVIIRIQSPSGTIVTIVDRPGYTGSGFGCNGDNILATLDDEAGSPVETQCAGSVPTINGTFSPNNPLSAFDGESTLGNWTLTVSDLVGSDTGTVNAWGITYTHDVVSPPLDVTLDGGGQATVNAEDLLHSVSVECGGYTVLAGTIPAATVDFDTSDIGLNNVDVIVTNDSGTSSTCTAVVNVIGPVGSGIVITCPSDITTDTDAGACGAIVTFADATATDAEDGPLSTTQTSGPLSGSLFPVGVTTVEFSATDSDGNTETCTFNVTVNDAEPPQITCPTDIIQDNDLGDCGAVVNYTVSTSDNCSGETMIQTAGLPSGSFFPLGTTTNTFEVTDANGNTASCSFDVTVNDTEDPTITCPVAIVQDNDPGDCGAVITYTAPVGSDNCAGAVTTQTAGLPSGSIFPVGTTTNTFLVTDASGNTATCSFTVTVNDTEDPVIICPVNIVQNNDPGDCGAVITYIAPVGSDNCAGAVTTQTAGLPSGSIFPVGTTTNTFLVTDASGNTTSCSFTVTVNDIENPVITCPANIVQNNDAGECGAVVSYTVNSSDNCSGETITQTAGLPSGSLFPVGTTTNTFLVTDANGNTATCSFDVTVNDNETPIIACPSDVIANTDGGMCSAVVIFPNPIAIDNCGVASITQTAGLPSGSDFPVGITTNTFEIIDINGNSISCSFDITVSDNEAPVINCPVDIVQGNDPGVCEAVVNYTITTSDNCGGETMVQTAGLPSGSVFPVGTTTNTFEVTDGVGNSSTCTFTVTVIDTEDPVFTGGAPVVDQQALVNNTCMATFNQTDLAQSFIPSMNSMSGASIFLSDWGAGSGDVTISLYDNLPNASGNLLASGTAIGVSDNQWADVTWAAVPVTPGSTYYIVFTSTNGGQCVSGDVNNGYPNGNVFANGGYQSFPGFDYTFKTFGGSGGGCPANITQSNDPGTCDAVVNYSSPIGVDNCTGAVTVQTGGLPSGSTFPVGVTTNTFEVTDASGNTATCSFDVIVNDTEAPVIVCPADLTVEVNEGELYTVPDYFGSGDASATDNCTDPVVLTTQNPAIGAQLGEGVHTITLTAEDAFGNISTCTFVLTIDTILGVADNQNLGSIQMYPNPANSSVTIGNPDLIQIERISIYDLNGRLVMNVNKPQNLSETTLDVSNFAAAVYMVQIVSEKGQVIKQLVKE